MVIFEVLTTVPFMLDTCKVRHDGCIDSNECVAAIHTCHLVAGSYIRWCRRKKLHIKTSILPLAQYISPNNISWCMSLCENRRRQSCLIHEIRREDKRLETCPAFRRWQCWCSRPHTCSLRLVSCLESEYHQYLLFQFMNWRLTIITAQVYWG